MSLFSQLTSAKQGQRTQTGITDYCSSGEKKTLLNVLFNKIVNTCHKADRTFYLEKKQNTGHTLGSMRWEHNKSPLLFIRPTYLKYVYLIKVVNLKINTSHKNQWHQYIWNGSLKKKKKHLNCSSVNKSYIHFSHSNSSRSSSTTTTSSNLLWMYHVW